MNPCCYSRETDPNLPNFSINLFTAIGAWQALFGDSVNVPDCPIVLKHRLRLWLKESDMDIESEEVFEALLLIITPDQMKKKEINS